MARIYWKEKKKNKEVLEEIGLKHTELLKTVKTRQLAYYGQIQHLQSLQKSIMEGKIDRKRQRCRKRKSWLGNIEETTTRRINKCCEVALDREEWRRTIASNLWQETKQRDGSICMWKTSDAENHLICINQVHRSETHCVDFTDSLIISGSRDTTCKVLNSERISDATENAVLKTFEAGERVWSLKISPSKDMFAAGLAGCLDDPPIVLWDLESGNCLAHLSVNHRRGAGVLDVRFESPNEMLTCGYDTFIRLWDMRTYSCVRQWEEPFDSALYCIDTDGENTMVVGTARNAMVRLWDKRQSDPIQMMYCKNSRSPVYSLAMDYGHLYMALDTGLTIMDFT
ncbi:F-box/WD repeat-containing protein 4-like [Elysia marginata]|uniref:F-box/WD repeat-containing protein 4-like n=1 Tax=Elysia marginata TaxID=1093978 RepID=A0AAV4EJ66_9GAST|nr:F-box/WD repeat-containing protein 4-like [Elysia marginata]